MKMENNPVSNPAPPPPLRPLTHHVITRQQFLQKFGFFVLNRFDDKLVVARDVEDGATGPRVGQLNEGLTAEGTLGGGGKETQGEKGSLQDAGSLGRGGHKPFPKVGALQTCPPTVTSHQPGPE